MNTKTFSGTVKAGKIEIDPPTTLPEGAHVSIVVPTILEEQTARLKANGWLIDYVGNMLMAKNGRLLQQGPTPTWQFEVFITALSHQPIGPIGHVQVNAHTGQIMNDSASIEAMIHVGQQLTRTP